jgi:hypothetical protein
MGAERLSLACVLLLGCYAPEFKTGAPCTTDSDCPSVQHCVSHVCGGTESGVDATTGDGDVGSETDLDGDGLVGGADNCPTAANADQGNEDGDTFGDVCDPCPIEANDTPSDPDGDGVADSCDPMPTTAGNQIVLFEGFHGALPTTWTLGSAVKAGDNVKITASGNNHSFIAPPLDAQTKVTIMTRVTIEQTTGADDADLGVSVAYNPSNDDGIRCELYSPTATQTANRDVSIWDSIQAATVGANPFPWVTGTPYLLSMERAGTNYTCRASAVGGTPVLTAGGTTSVPAQQKYALRVYAATATISYVLVVTNP